MVSHALPKVVLDTSAVLTLLYGEPRREVVRAVLDRAEAGECELHLAFLTPMEVEYRLHRKRFSLADVDAVLSGIEAWPAEIHESDQAWRREAACMKGYYPMSMADAWIGSLALRLDAELVHKDPEFDPVPGLKALRL